MLRFLQKKYEKTGRKYTNSGHVRNYQKQKIAAILLDNQGHLTFVFRQIDDRRMFLLMVIFREFEFAGDDNFWTRN